MANEFFTQGPHWAHLGVLYFFVGGIAGGCFFVAALLDLLRGPSERHLSRIGYLVAFPAISIGGLLLMADLKYPIRFWHMMIQNQTGWPMFKWWSPISYGTWIILTFSAFAGVAFLASLIKPGETPSRGPLRWFQMILYGLGPFSKAFLVIGAIFGLWLASYTGVLLSVTNRPVWANSSLISLLFVVSGVSAGAATMVLLGGRRRATVSHDSLHMVARFDDWVLMFELVVLAAVLISVWEILDDMTARWLTGWGLALLGFVLVGILTPLALTLRPRLSGTRVLTAAAIMVLVGGLALRAIVVYSSEFTAHV